MLVRSVVLAALFSLALPAGAASPAPFAQLPPTPVAPLVGEALPRASVHARSADDAAAISRGLRRAVARGRLTPAEAREHRAVVRRARAVIRRAPHARSTVLARVLGQVRWQAGAFTRPRALALFSMLRENADLLARRALPPDRTDYVGRGRVVYRVGWGYGLQFHPLANVAALNAHVSAGRLRAAATLAGSLASRAVRRPNRAAVWEYYFPYAGGRPPWTSGMVQAVGAQAFARAGRRLAAPDFFGVAERAYRSLPGRLLRPTSAGPWARLYSFSRLLVLNAQLQAVLSLRGYGGIVGSDPAMRLAERMDAAARRLLPSFDTGAWSNYVPGREAALNYHLYHVSLTRFLAQRTGRQVWQAANARFARYTREPPGFSAGAAAPPFYPWPRDGFRDSARISFWLSKISTVSVAVGGARFSLGLRRRGWHSVVWRPGRRPPRVHRPVVSAVDLAGNRGSAPLRPVTLAVDRTAPVVRARVEGRRRLVWRAVDRTTPWIRMWAVIRRADVKRRLDLGRRPLSGSLVLGVPRGTWRVVLWVDDSTGNRARVALGPVPAPR